MTNMFPIFNAINKLPDDVVRTQSEFVDVFLIVVSKSNAHIIKVLIVDPSVYKRS